MRAAPTAVMTLPESGPRIGTRIRAASDLVVIDAPDIGSAVREALHWLDGEGVVLLSPAAPSFTQFRNWKERSEAFAAAVDELAGPSA